VPATPTSPIDLPAYLRERAAFDAATMAPGLAATASVIRAASAFGAAPPAPFPFPVARDLWLARMRGDARRHAAAAVAAAALWDAGNGDENTFALTYYDGARAFENVGRRLGEWSPSSPWALASDACTHLYRDTYLEPGNYNAPGYWIFPHGLLAHFRRTGDPRSRAAVLGLATRAAFANDLSDANQPDALKSADMARENAYALMAHLCAEALGAPHRAETDRRVADAFGHIAQWFGHGEVPAGQRRRRVQPFIFALVAEALIQLDAATPGGHPGVVPALVAGCDAMWASHWDGESGLFRYVHDDDPAHDELSHDLSLLIAPAYGHAYARTRAVDPLAARHRDRGDAAFAGGARYAYFAGDKQCNQCFRWSPDYEAWRGRSFRVEVPPSDRVQYIRTVVPFGGEPYSYPLPDEPPDDMPDDMLESPDEPPADGGRVAS
jgi:hypothetical protein